MITKQHKSTGNDKSILKTGRNEVTNENVNKALIAMLLLFTFRPQQRLRLRLRQRCRQRLRQRTRQRRRVG